MKWKNDKEKKRRPTSVGYRNAGESVQGPAKPAAGRGARGGDRGEPVTGRGRVGGRQSVAKEGRAAGTSETGSYHTSKSRESY